MRLNNAKQFILVDANFLIAWKGTANNPALKSSIERFIRRLAAARGVLIVPTPALAEYLVRADMEGMEAMHALASEPWAMFGSFDYKAAAELHLLDRATQLLGDKRGGVDAPWQKIKVDRQLVAIGRAMGCDLIISNDRSVLAGAMRAGLTTSTLENLDEVTLPPPHVTAVREQAMAYPWLPNSPTSQSRNTAVSS